MRRFFKKSYRWAIVWTITLTIATSLVLLQTFVFPQRMKVVAANTSSSTQSTSQQSTTATEATTTSTEPTITDTSYQDDQLTINLTTTRSNDTTVYIADVQTSDSSLLKTALAENSYGRNIKETTSAMAKSNQAILAINGDYYGFRNNGYVVRNGVLYRDTVNSDTDALVIDQAGDFSIVEEGTTSAQDLVANGAQQILSFGPALVENGKISVSETAEVGQSMSSNPRTAIGQIDSNHYVIIVADGRTDESEGLSLYELAEEFQKLGVKTAYNLDGGGSSTLYFNGKVVNQPTSGQSSGERAVSDIVYFGE